MRENRSPNRNGVDQTFDPAVCWLVVRNSPRDDGGYQPVRVHDLYPLTFAPGKDLSALRAEAGAAFEHIKLRLLNADGILAEAEREVRFEVRQDSLPVKPGIIAVSERHINNQ